MGRWFRKIWIGLLSGAAALTACSLFSPPPCYYGPPPPSSDEDSITTPVKNDRREMLQKRIDAIRGILEERRFSEVYGSPEVMEAFEEENARLQAEADSLEQELIRMDVRYQRRRDLEQKLESIRNTIEEREGSRVYGSPEIIKEYKRKTQLLKEEAATLEAELEALEKEQPNN